MAATKDTVSKEDLDESEIRINVDQDYTQQKHHPKTHSRRRPLTYLLSSDSKEAQEKNLSVRVALYKAALNSDWKEADKIIGSDPRIKTAAITKSEETVLHVAVGAQNVEFVQQLMKLMSKEDVLLQDDNENTAFCYAAVTGNLEMAQVLMSKNESLLFIPGGQGVTPLYLAASFGRAEMASFLYPKTIHVLEDGERKGLFLQCLYFGLYDLALKMFKEDRSLVWVRDPNKDTALHILARRPKAFQDNRNILKKYMMFVSNKSHDHTETEALKLTRELWREILHIDEEDSFRQIIDTPSKLLFDAAESGNFQFLSELIRPCPDLLTETNEDLQTIFHVAALNRHTRIFHLLNEIGFKKNVITAMEDKDGNNLLHHAGTLVPSCKYDCGIRQILLQLRQEFKWFKEVKKIVEPYYKEKQNLEGLTAEELFSKTHKTLLREGDQWIKSTSSLCIVVSAIIMVGIVVVSFTTSSNVVSGSSRIIESPFLTCSLLTSTISLIIFFCTLINSCYGDMEILLSLLLVGIAMLFASVMTMVTSSGRIFGQLRMS